MKYLSCAILFFKLYKYSIIYLIVKYCLTIIYNSMSESSSPLNCDLSKLNLELKNINKEIEQLQDKIKNVYADSGCVKEDNNKMEQIKSYKEIIEHAKKAIENEEKDRNRSQKIDIQKNLIKIYKEKLKNLGEDVSPIHPIITHFYTRDGRIIARGTRKKRGKASRRRQIKKIKKTR